MIQFETKPAEVKDQVVPTSPEKITTKDKTASVGHKVVTCGNDELDYKEKIDNTCWTTYD
ncbi:MAG: hypothetical protein ChlgKO_06130 [Chlamydiales bacterium]